MYFICRNCGEYTRIHKKSNYCWKCGSDKITSADSKVEAEKAKREAVGKQDITAVSGRAKSTSEEIAREKEVKTTAAEVIALIKSKDPSYNEALWVLTLANGLLNESKII